jgi:6-phosphogluconate dehydrogenase
MLEAIGEGFELLAEGPFPDLDLHRVAYLWNRGSVVRGWLMELMERAFARDPRLTALQGVVGGGSTGSWAIEEAWKAGVPFPAIAIAYAMRHRSRQEDSFAGKVVAALRSEFGGHETVGAKEVGEAP